MTPVLYKLQILPRAQRELASLAARDCEKVESAIRTLAAECRPRNCRKLTGREGWRIRVGRFRVIYEIDDGPKTVTIGHRKDVYR